MEFKGRNLEVLADLIVRNARRDDAEDEAKCFPYRYSMYITEFFQKLETKYQRRPRSSSRRLPAVQSRSWSSWARSSSRAASRS